MDTADGIYYEDLEVGSEARSPARTMTETDIVNFAGLSGDFNVIHTDAELTQKTPFGQRIAHGLFSSGLISAALGTKLPGPGSVYLKQELKFLYPVRAGDTLTAEVEVTAWRPDKRIITLSTRCLNQDGRDVVDGEAVLLVEQI